MSFKTVFKIFLPIFICASQAMAMDNELKNLNLLHPKVMTVDIPSRNDIQNEVKTILTALRAFFESESRYDFVHKFFWYGVPARLIFMGVQDRGYVANVDARARNLKLLDLFLSDRNFCESPITLVRDSYRDVVSFSYDGAFRERLVIELRIPTVNYEKCSFTNTPRDNIKITPAEQYAPDSSANSIYMPFVSSLYLNLKPEIQAWHSPRGDRLPSVTCKLKKSYQQDLSDLSFDSVLREIKGGRIVPSEFQAGLPLNNAIIAITPSDR